MIKKRLMTDLSPSECLRGIKKIREAAEHDSPTITIKEKYKNYFMPSATREGRHIYSSVKDNGFDIYMTVWYPMAGRNGGRWIETQEKYSSLSGTVMENEEGGSIVEYTMLDHSLTVLLFTGILLVLFIVTYVDMYFTTDASLGALLIVYLTGMFPLSATAYYFVGAYKCRKNLQSVLRDIVDAK